MTAPANDFNVLLALSHHGMTDADRLEADAEQLEQRAYECRMEAAKLRACARTLGRFG